MNVLVTGGGTIAPIDDVRVIANVSTGNFSAAISEACLNRGANVFHLHAPSAALPFSRHANLDFRAGEPEFDRLRRLQGEWQRSADRLHLISLKRGTVADYRDSLYHAFIHQSIDLAFLAMAVSDFEPEVIPGKIDSRREPLEISLKPTPKVIRSVRDWAPSTYLVGFKLTSGASDSALIELARQACLDNRAELTIANDLSTLRSGHRVHLVRPHADVLTIGPAENLAERVVDQVFPWVAEKSR